MRHRCGPSRRLALNLGAVLLMAGCGGGGSPAGPASNGAPTPEPTPVPTVLMRGDVQDGTGDTATDRRLAVAPDLVSGSIEVLSDGRVRFRARFAPGTYARETTKVQFDMDTDENSSTGETLPGVLDIGVDYIVVVGSSYYGAVGHLRKVEIGGFVSAVATGDATFTSDGIDLTLPGAGVNARMAFHISTSSQVSQIGGFTSVLDYAPNERAAPALVR